MDQMSTVLDSCTGLIESRFQTFKADRACVKLSNAFMILSSVRSPAQIALITVKGFSFTFMAKVAILAVVKTLLVTIFMVSHTYFTVILSKFNFTLNTSLSITLNLVASNTLDSFH